MDNVKNEDYYISRIYSDMVFITRYMSETDEDTFSENELLQDSMMFRLIQISENARKLTDVYREQHSIIPWKQYTAYGTVLFMIMATLSWISYLKH